MPKKQYNGVVYTCKYIQYNDDGEVFGITGLPDNNFRNFEIGIDLIPNFISYKKDYKKYNIDYFLKISEGIITDEDEIEDYFKNEFIFYNIPIDLVDHFDILIIHDSINKKWVFTSKVSKLMLETIVQIPFYVTIKNKHNFLVSSYTINAVDLYNKEVVLDFLSDYETDITKISLLTNRKFKNYSVKKI